MDIDPRRLTHWSRVAFAARLARRVQPLFMAAWPDATAERVEAVERAIALAERSVAERQPCDGLKQAEMAAIMAAGRAYMAYDTRYPIEDDEPSPPDADAALAASFAAKVAEHAATAARLPPDESATAVRAAYGFALDAIRHAAQPGLIELIEADFEMCKASTRPWWRFW